VTALAALSTSIRVRLVAALASCGMPTIVVAGLAALASLAWTLAAAGSGATTGTGTGLVLGVAAVVLAFAAALAVLDPWAGLVAWIALMGPLNVARLGLPIGGVLMTQTSVVLLATSAGLVVAKWQRRPTLGPIPRSVWAIALPAAALALVSGLASSDPASGVTIALHGIVEPGVVAVLVVGLATSQGRVRVLAGAMIASVLLATLYNLERLVRITLDLSIAQSDRTAFARFTYYNVGIFGDMLVMTLPLAVILLLESRRRGSKRTTWIWTAVVTTLALGLYLTFTKGPWLAGLLSLTVLLLFVSRTRRGRTSIVAAALVLATLIVPYPSYALRAIDPVLADQILGMVATLEGGNRADSWDPETAEGEVSIRERLLATVAAFEMARDHPLFGVGPGNFGAAYQGGYRPADATRDLGSAHDMVPDVAAEFGTPLAVVLVVWISGVLLAAWRLVRRRGPRHALMALGFAAGFGAFLVVSVSFGVDLYRPWRVMNSDVVFAAILGAGIVALSRLAGGSGPWASQQAREGPKL